MEAAPQRVHIDCRGRKFNPQRSQNNVVSEIRAIRTSFQIGYSDKSQKTTVLKVRSSYENEQVTEALRDESLVDFPGRLRMTGQDRRFGRAMNFE